MKQSDVRAMRLAAGWPVERLAVEAGVHPATVKRAEQGRPVSSDTLWRLSIALKHALAERHGKIAVACRAAGIALPTS
jgi:transcriptional regulator with XRE-family HTH domain